MKWLCTVPVLILAVIFVISPLSCPAAIVHVKASSTHRAPDGKQWSSAFRSIGQAIVAAQPGDEVWVAQGTYAQDLVIDKGIALYGGFSDDDYPYRDVRQNPTIIQSVGLYECISIRQPGVTVDGFTVRRLDGIEKTGIQSYSSSVIAHNTVEGFHTGILVHNQRNDVFGNTVKGNLYGIRCGSGFQLVYSNIIAANFSSGISCDSNSSAAVINNTVVENGGAGISCAGSHVSIANNIVAFNLYGIYCNNGELEVEHNCVYGNTATNYPNVSDKTGMNGNISVDPMLAACPDDCHIQPGSPCRDNGSNTFLEPNWVDFDGQQRVLPYSYSSVDIGADESDGNYYHYTDRPAFSRLAGIYYDPLDVVISCPDADAAIHYTTNGSEPTPNDLFIASGGSVRIEKTTKLKARAFHEGLQPSATRAALYEITGHVAAPVVSLQGGFYDRVQYVTLSCATPDANIVYTLDGSEPYGGGGRVLNYYGSPIRIDMSLTLKARAMKYNWIASDVVIADYTLREPRTVFVDSSVQGSEHSGISWADAYSSISDALRDSIRGDGIWVAEGVYKERLSLQLGIAVYGGFSGDETSLGQRDWSLHQTVIDGEQAGTVITVDWKTQDAVLDGFVIRNGSATEGGGIKCGAGSSTIANNTITDCAAQRGGGVFLVKSNTDFENNVIYGCSATESGGGIYLSADSSHLRNNIIVDNRAAISGGGVYAEDFYGGIYCSNISSNSAGVSGGGVCYSRGYNGNYLYDSVIWGNAAGSGAAVYADSIKMVHNTIAGNHGSTSSVCLLNDNKEIVNNIIAFNTGGLVYSQYYNPPTIKNNCLFANTGGNYTGIADPTGTDGNISADPKLANVKSGDLHIMPGSPCIDAGIPTDPLNDLDRNPRPRDGDGDGIEAADIGCYEAPANYMGLASAKALADGSLVGVSSQVSTAVFDCRLYVEDPSRICGIGIIGFLAETGQRVTVEGVMSTIDGERMIIPTSFTQNGLANMPSPWFINLDGIGGGPLGLQAGVQDYRPVKDQLTGKCIRTQVGYGGANNIGLLVKTCGVVTARGEGFFYLDSGCVFDDGDEGVNGVRVDWPFADAMPQHGSRVEITAISSCTLKYGLVVRLLRPVSAGAVRIL